jgi:putative ABC transport system substrate-binding protein
MRRRDVLSFATGLAAFPLLAVRAQQKVMPVIGFLGNTSPGLFQARLASLRKGLSETGYVEGQNLAIEYRWAEGHYDRLAALAAELVARKVNVIATGGTPAARAVQKGDLDDPRRFRRRR